jgi:hypothetical protein
MKPHKKIAIDLKKYPEVISRVLLVILVILMIGATIWISGPLPQRDSEGMIITPQATDIGDLQAASGRTAPDVLETTPTSGVILATLGVVLIILGGTAITLRSQK